MGINNNLYVVTKEYEVYSSSDANARLACKNIEPLHIESHLKKFNCDGCGQSRQYPKSNEIKMYPYVYNGKLFCKECVKASLKETEKKLDK